MPLPHKWLVPFFNYKVFLLCSVLHPWSQTCIFEPPHCCHEKGQKLMKWPVICGHTNFFWPFQGTCTPTSTLSCSITWWYALMFKYPRDSSLCMILGLENCCSLALKQLWNGLVFTASLVTRCSRYMSSFCWVFCTALFLHCTGVQTPDPTSLELLGCAVNVGHI